MLLLRILSVFHVWFPVGCNLTAISTVQGSEQAKLCSHDVPVGFNKLDIVCTATCIAGVGLQTGYSC